MNGFIMTNISNNELLVNLPNLSDEQWPELRKWLVSFLLCEKVTVTFTKKDGTERVMHCTLDPTKLPPQPIKENVKERKENLDILSVYDLEANGWRSFTVKSIKNIKLEV
jgi:hypothetical protein